MFVIVIPRPQPPTQVSIEISAADTLGLKSDVHISSPVIASSDIVPVRPKTGVLFPIVAMGCCGLPAPDRHLSERMFKQLKHRPHAACRLTMTRSPTRALTTCGPMASTMPTPP